jgi:hypothetical protein
MWSDEAPDPDFLALLESVFPSVRAEVVTFDNPLTGGSSTCTIYVAGSTVAGGMVDATGIEPVTPSV